MDPPKPAAAAYTPQAPGKSAGPESATSRSQGGPIAGASQAAWPEDLAGIGRDALAALAQSHEALAQGLEALGAEMTGLALSGIDAATRAASGMIGVRTLSDAIDVSTGLACRSLETWGAGSAKLSKLGFRLAAETSRPLLTQLGCGCWVKASRRGS